MAIVAIESVRSKFEPGDSPKGSDYLDLIDTLAALPDISGKQDVVANVSSTEIGYLDGVTSAIQTQINTKAPTASPTFTGTVTIPSGSAITGVPYLATANTFTGGVQQITTASAATVGLIVKGAASQTANLQQWHNSAGTANTLVRADGSIGVPSISSQGGGAAPYLILGSTAFTLYSNTSTNIGLVVKGAASQTANLQEWQDSSSSVITKIAYNGAIDSTVQITGRSAVTAGTGNYLSASLNVIPLNASIVGAVIKSYASQTADLQQWQNSAGTVLSRVASNGVIKANVGLVAENSTLANYTALQVNSNMTNGNGIIIVGASGQTADLQQWKNSAGTVLTSVDKDGYLQTPRLVITTGGNITDSAGTTPYFGFGSNQIAIYARNASYKPLIIQGATSQTANLQEWQDSGGTTLGFFNAYGTLTANNRIYAGWAAFGSGYGTAASASNIVLIAKGSASQTANLQEWQNSAGGVLLNIDSTGNLDIGAGSSNIWKIKNQTSAVMEWQPSQGFMFLPYGASNRPVIIRGAASQTANLTEWQNSAGTALTYVNSAGVIVSTAGAYLQVSGGYGIQSTAGSATTVPIIAQGAASQTANLQQWQNSAGTVLAKISASGNIVAGDMAIATSSVSTIHISNGTIPSANPTGGGVLYVEAGALKFRGSSGTITTIAVA